MKNLSDYENYIGIAKRSARRKGEASVTATDGTLIEANREGEVWVDGVKVEG